MNGPIPRGPSGAIVQQPKNALLLIRFVGEISSKLPKATPDNEEGGIGTAGTIQEAQKCRSIGHGKLDRTGNRSLECTKCAAEVAAPSQP